MKGRPCRAAQVWIVTLPAQILAPPILSQATQRDPDSSEGFQYLAMAYDREGDRARSQLASAQALVVSGKYVEARTQAKRAQDQFKEGAPGWLKADDILNYRPPEFD